MNRIENRNEQFISKREKISQVGAKREGTQDIRDRSHHDVGIERTVIDHRARPTVPAEGLLPPTGLVLMAITESLGRYTASCLSKNVGAVGEGKIVKSPLSMERSLQSEL